MVGQSQPNSAVHAQTPEAELSGVLLWADQRLHGLLLSVMTAKASHAGKQEK